VFFIWHLKSTCEQQKEAKYLGTYSIGPVLGLKVVRWVPVGIKDDDRVGSGDVQPNAAHTRGEQEDEDAPIGVELAHYALPRHAIFHPTNMVGRYLSSQ